MEEKFLAFSKTYNDILKGFTHLEKQIKNKNT